MQALWLEQRRLSIRDDLPVPKPAPGEVLIRVRLAGICGTDLELVKGYYPYAGVPGHEFVGEVVDCPDTGLAGQRVVGEINAACGQCDPCVRGTPTHCEGRTVLGIKNRNGAFAEYLTLPAANLHRVPETVSDDAAVFTEPLAAALQIQQQVSVRASDRVLLIGAGRLGQLIAQTLALTGCDLGVVVRHDGQRRLLRDRGIPCLVPEDVMPRSFDLVVDATGSPEGFELARQAVRARGTLILKSTYRGAIPVDLSALVVDEITVVGSRCGPFPAALRLLEQHAIDPTPLITERYPLRYGIEAFENARTRGTLKVLLEP